MNGNLDVWTTIFVPTDFSPASDAALALASRLAKEQNARLEVLHVVELGGGLEASTRIQPEDAGSPIRVEEFVRARSLPRMHAQMQRVGLAPSDHRCFIAFGRPADTIVREAALHGADLIVLATHGRRGLERWFVGSCAEAVVRRASMPVLTVRVPGDEPTLTPEERALRDESTG